MRSNLSPLAFGAVVAAAVFVVHPGQAAAGPAPAKPGPLRSEPVALNVNRIRQFAQEEEAREKGLFLSTLAHGNPDLKEVALTFDDGPHPAWTPKLLDLLKSLDVKATFFLVGKMVDKYPALAMREVAEGHEVANHTYDHSNLTKLKPVQVEDELKRGADAIKRAVGYSPVFFRPPGGQYNESTLQTAKAMKLTPVLWTANPKDFLHPAPDVVEQRLLSAPAAGGILLCHDGIEETMRILPDLVKRLRSKGYTFVTVSELARHMKSAAAQ